MSETDVVFSLAGKRIFVAGHKGMVGSAVMRRLAREDCDVVTADRAELDLKARDQVDRFLQNADVDAIVVCAAKVGGILANDSQPADFLFDNLVIEANLIDGAHRADVDRLLFLGSTCIYPKLADQPIKETSLLTGPLEPTNQWYAIAKIAGVKLCDAYRKQYGRRYISAMPTNLYGPNDNFDLNSSHVLPALMRKIDKAAREGLPTVEIWGDGSPLREFMHVDDLADALVFLLQHYDLAGPINVGTGEDVSIRDLASLLSDLIGFTGEFAFDSSKPSGTPRKVTDVGLLNSLGWRFKTSLRDGVASTYRWYQDNREALEA